VPFGAEQGRGVKIPRGPAAVSDDEEAKRPLAKPAGKVASEDDSRARRPAEMDILPTYSSGYGRAAILRT